MNSVNNEQRELFYCLSDGLLLLDKKSQQQTFSGLIVRDACVIWIPINYLVDDWSDINRE